MAHDPGRPVTRVVCQQLDPPVGDPAQCRALALEACAAAGALGADVCVLPELVTSGYVFASGDEAAAAALRADAPELAAWGRALGRPGGVVVGGFCERGSDGHLYDSAAVVGAGGVLAVYRKLHLWDREQLVFAAGGAPPPVVATPAGRIAPLVCYDLEFPELVRSVALRGAEMLAVPTSWPLVERPAGERPPEVLAAMVGARTNRVAIACCDRRGVERGQAFTAGTAIVDEQGWVVAEAGSATTACADLDLSRSRDKAIGPRNDAFADRRPEHYVGLLDR